MPASTNATTPIVSVTRTRTSPDASNSERPPIGSCLIPARRLSDTRSRGPSRRRPRRSADWPARRRAQPNSVPIALRPARTTRRVEHLEVVRIFQFRLVEHEVVAEGVDERLVVERQATTPRRIEEVVAAIPFEQQRQRDQAEAFIPAAVGLLPAPPWNATPPASVMPSRNCRSRPTGSAPICFRRRRGSRRRAALR